MRDTFFNNGLTKESKGIHTIFRGFGGRDRAVLRGLHVCVVKKCACVITCVLVHSLICNLVVRFLSLCLPVIWLPAQVAWLIFQAYQLARGRGEVAAWRENFGSNSKGESHCSFLLRTTWSGVRRCNLILASHIPGQCQRKATRKTVIYAMPCTVNFIRDTVTSGFHKVRTIQ